MCRLYAFKANEPTRVECSLVHAQNALIAQSEGDSEGLVHGHGWGVADYRDGLPLIEKQSWAAFHGTHFAKKAARIYAHTVIAHVRRATVGVQSLENTHPFQHIRWIFAHNGTIPNFSRVRDQMLPNIDPLFRNEIKGTTDSEHIFYYLLSLHYKHTEISMMDIVEKGINQIINWSREIDPEAEIGLNIVLTDGDHLVGSCYGRTLWHLERELVFECPICGKSHVHHEVGSEYRAVEVASEPLTDENWHKVPDGVVYSFDEDYYFLTQPIHSAT